MSVAVHVFSFGYLLSGVPEDPTGAHGGGFVFDCRCLPNPGRQPEYLALSGLDQPVIDYLENYPGVQIFSESCFKLVGQAVEAYQKRGFTDLMVAFGCTGGQHRSVYQAVRLAERLEALPATRPKVIHTERNRWDPRLKHR